MSQKEIAVKVENLTKTFHIPLEAHSGLKQMIINTIKGRKGYREFSPLKDVSFEIEKGDFFGIVGRNGSGKSTLLKTLAGIYSPDHGAVHVNGSLVPFIELGVGFNPELTGRENVFLNGALLGFSRKEMERMYDEIVEFAELGDFMEERLKNYSSGMQVRLAFSIAIRADGDILLLDEVLAVGDEAFQRKCYSYFAELRKNKKTVILVTHSMDAVQKFCTKALFIKDGNIEYIGSTAQVASLYHDDNMENDKISKRADDGSSANDNVKAVARLKNNPSDPHLLFDIEVISKVDMPNAVMALSLTKDSGEIVYRWASDEKLTKNILVKKGKKLEVKLNIQNIFPNGVFSLNVSLRSKDMTIFYFTADEIIDFQIINKSSHSGDIYWKPNDKVEIL